MSTSIQSRVLHPAFLKQQLRGEALVSQPDTPSPAPASLLGALRAQSQHEAVTPAADRNPLKHLLAHSKLMAGLVASVIVRPDTSAQDIAAAAHWVQTQVEALAGRFQDAGCVLNGYQRHVAAALFVHLIEQHPALLQAPLPAPVMDALCTPEAIQGEAETPPWKTLGAQADVELAWSRALAQVLASAQTYSFNRPADDLLQQARKHLETLAHSRFEHLSAVLGPRQMADPDAQTVVFLHALNTCTRVYTASMARLSQDSVTAIAEYAVAKAHGHEDKAERLAWDYQTRKLGYEHLLWHAQQAIDSLDDLLLSPPVPSPQAMLHQQHPTTTPVTPSPSG